MARVTKTFTVDVEFDDSVTDEESVATALDLLTETALSTPGVTEEYGGIEVKGFYPKGAIARWMERHPIGGGAKV